MTGFVERLAEMLRICVSGLYFQEAAVELLIRHEAWLWRHDFVRRFIEIVEPEPEHSDEDPTVAFVAWEDAIAALDDGALPCSTSEAQILRIAASIAAGTPIMLRDCLGGLDLDNIRLVLTALAHANGHRGGVILR